MKTLKLEKIKLHVIFWAIFIAYELAVSFSFGGRFTTFPDYASHYLLNISLFYLNAYLVFPTAINRERKSYFILALLIIAELVLYMLLKYLLTNLLVGF